MRKAKLNIHRQRFWPPSRILGLEHLPDPEGEFLDLKPGQEINVIEVKHGQYLCEKDGYYCWISTSWVREIEEVTP